MVKDNRGFYDSNILIAYLFKEEDKFNIAKEVLEKHFIKALSIISIHEIHMYSVRFNVEDKFMKIKETLHKLFKIIPINQDICVKASHLRKEYKLPEVDSLILATAIHHKYKHFYSFDKDFEKINNKIIEGVRIHYLK